MMNFTRQTVLSVFIGRCRDLATENHGVALATTLAFIAPIYLILLGIFGIGEIVRYKIELQNAADNAAYSASVVQADYLSRMAVVNKAMAWTYVDLQKRSLDYAMDGFVCYVLDKYEEDWDMTRQKNLSGHCCVEHEIREINYFVGKIVRLDKIKLVPTLKKGLKSPGKADWLEEFDTQGEIKKVRLEHAKRAFTSKRHSCEKKIKQYKEDIDKMNKRLEDLKEEMNKQVRDTALEVAVANMVECKDDYVIKIIGNGGSDDSFEKMKTSEENEKTFISFADMIDSDAKYDTQETNQNLKKFDPQAIFGGGTNYWIKLDTSRKEGFLRIYQQQGDNHHYAKWSWAWNYWKHVSHKLVCICTSPEHKPRYDHGTTEVRGTDVTSKYGFDSKKPMVNSKCFGGYISAALPWVLTEKFFGEGGTITVAIARKTRNPLLLFSSSDTDCNGMLSAFNVTTDDVDGSRPEYMLAVASARAGYKNYNSDKESKRNSRQYVLGFTKLNNSEREKQWNLCETDWDGMLVPVRFSKSTCTGESSFENQKFGQANDDILKTIVQSSNWVDKDGNSASETPNFENMDPPGGLDGSGSKLEWQTVGTYLRH